MELKCSTIKSQLCANCARKNLPITGALPASTTSSMSNMLQLAQITLLVRAGIFANPHSTRWQGSEPKWVHDWQINKQAGEVDCSGLSATLGAIIMFLLHFMLTLSDEYKHDFVVFVAHLCVYSLIQSYTKIHLNWKMLLPVSSIDMR